MGFMAIVDYTGSPQIPTAIISTGTFPGTPFFFSSATSKQPVLESMLRVVQQSFFRHQQLWLSPPNPSGLSTTWSPLEVISSGTNGQTPAISVSSNGGMVAYWVEDASNTVTLKTGFAGSFESTPTQRSTKWGLRWGCMSNSGTAYAGWLNISTSDGTIEATRTIQSLNLLEALGNKRLIFQRGLMQ